MQATLDQPSARQLLIAIGPGHVPVRARQNVGDADRSHGVQQPQVLHAQRELQIVQLQKRLVPHQFVQPADECPRSGGPPGKPVHIQPEAQQL